MGNDASAPGSAISCASEASAAACAQDDADQLRRDNQYYKAVNRELKRRLRGVLEEGSEGSRVMPGDCTSTPIPASAHVEDLAAQVERLESEKASAEEEKERVMRQIQNLKQYAA